jgi:hypothetical protein
VTKSFALKATLVAAALLGSSIPLAASATAAPVPNPIVIENRHAGSDHWQVPWTGFQVGADIHLQVKAFAANETTTPGGSVDLKITVTPAQNYVVDVLRLGYYQGLGGREMTHLGPFSGLPQPPCVTKVDTRTLTCPWTASVTVKVPTSWISGVYVAVISTDSKFQSLAPFWVIDDTRHSDLLYNSAINTYQAYNNFPYEPPPSNPAGLPQTGHSLYDFNSAGGIPAVKVSFDRPFNSQYGGPGDGGLYDFEPELISFIEKNGYDTTYTNDQAVDAKPASLLTHKAVVIGGHAEYWTQGAYDGAITAREVGVGLAFITANEIYWQVRYEPNSQGVPRRVMVGYKDWAPDPFPNPALRTIKWRDLGRPEQKLSGVQFPTNGNQNWGGQWYVPRSTTNWAYAGTGMVNAEPVRTEAVGYEIDSYDATVGRPQGTKYTTLSASPFLNFQGQWYVQNSSIYLGSGHNWVWATGSMDWSWTLSPGGSSVGNNNVRKQMQVMTNNILKAMIASAPHRV